MKQDIYKVNQKDNYQGKAREVKWMKELGKILMITCLNKF